jgi:pSer/pThr/pTyr-binding forkhead associated (FHA) protein
MQTAGISRAIPGRAAKARRTTTLPLNEEMGDMNSSEQAPAYIVGLNQERGGMQLPVVGPSFSIGRDARNNLRLAHDPKISQHHCVIHTIGASLFLEDRSRNGTFLNGSRVQGMVPLDLPASVQLGETHLSIGPKADG